VRCREEGVPSGGGCGVERAGRMSAASRAAGGWCGAAIRRGEGVATAGWCAAAGERGGAARAPGRAGRFVVPLQKLHMYGQLRIVLIHSRPSKEDTLVSTKICTLNFIATLSF